MPERSEYDTFVQDLEGNAYANVQVNVYLAGTVSYASIYAAKTGAGTLSNPITVGPTGNIQFWADPGSYDIKFHDLNSPARFSDRTINWEAVSGEDDGIDWDQLEKPAGGIPGADIADNAIDQDKIAPNSVGSGEIIDGTVGPAELSAAAEALFVPVGSILATARSSAPTGWLLCTGAAVSRTTYADLFSAIGTAYGTGDGSTTFNVPDLRGRVPAGVDSGAGRITGAALGGSGGTQTHVITIAELPSHGHNVTISSHSHNVSISDHQHYIAQSLFGSGGGYNYLGGSPSLAIFTAGLYTEPAGGGTFGSTSAGGGTFGSSSVGSGTAHNNLQPYQVVNYMIKA